MPRLVLAASLMAAFALAGCGSATPAPTQSPAPSVSAPPLSPTPSTPTDPSVPSAEPPVATPAPPVDPTPRPSSVSFTRAERYLIDGIMRGEGDCSPVRGDDLPGAAIAGVDCELVGSPVARAGYYLFDSDADMLDAYFARMRAEGIAIDSGPDCSAGSGEGAYIPYGEGETAPDRHGCFVNDEGYGNYRVTMPGAHVYVGLLGRTADMDVLVDWAWIGNQDVPGNPTLWAQSDVYRP
jgi:hypothetical protein